MRKITALVLVAATAMAVHVGHRVLERKDSWVGTSAEASTITEPASADSLLVMDRPGAEWKEARLRPLSEVGYWILECDGQDKLYQNVSLGSVVDAGRSCDVYEVTSLDGLH